MDLESYRKYRWKWMLIGGLLWFFVMILTMFIELYLHDVEYYMVHSHDILFTEAEIYSIDFLIFELFEDQRLFIIFIGLVIGAAGGYFYGKYKEKDLERSAYLREYSKEFLHDAMNHLAIITGYASLLEKHKDILVINEEGEDVALIEPILKKSKHLTLHIKEKLMELQEYDKNGR